MSGRYLQYDRQEEAETAHFFDTITRISTINVGESFAGNLILERAKERPNDLAPKFVMYLQGRPNLSALGVYTVTPDGEPALSPPNEEQRNIVSDTLDRLEALLQREHAKQNSIQKNKGNSDIFESLQTGIVRGSTKPGR